MLENPGSISRFFEHAQEKRRNVHEALHFIVEAKGQRPLMPEEPIRPSQALGWVEKSAYAQSTVTAKMSNLTEGVMT